MSLKFHYFPYYVSSFHYDSIHNIGEVYDLFFIEIMERQAINNPQMALEIPSILWQLHTPENTGKNVYLPVLPHVHPLHNFIHIETSLLPGSCGVPTLPEFISFPMAVGRVNLAQKIGTAFENFGILLLGDNDGDRTDAIVRELRERAEDINKRIFRLWVKGEGLQPVSWATLVGVLHNIGLNTLARDIHQVKFPKSQ